MGRTRFVAVGACAVDTILTVPHFPVEDSKLRATSFTKRRGGNSANTLEVLQQLIQHDYETDSLSSNPENSARGCPAELALIATLPARNSAQTAFIASSFDHSHAQDCANVSHFVPNTLRSSTKSIVELACVHREDFTEPVSSYIISSQSNSSRTIINHNELPEMTLEEFTHLVLNLIPPLGSELAEPIERAWFHFEGRIPTTILECIRYLRRQPIFNPEQAGRECQIELIVSVELEKPGREGLQALAQEADVIFYSKSWAEGEGYANAEVCLRKQACILSSSNIEGKEKLLICTWGKDGACALALANELSSTSTSIDASKPPILEQKIIHSPAYASHDQPIVDTTGAGDTFIAGVLYGLMCQEVIQSRNSVRGGHRWFLLDVLQFANGLAGRKILHNGFSGLGEVARELTKVLRSSQTE